MNSRRLMGLTQRPRITDQVWQVRVVHCRECRPLISEMGQTRTAFLGAACPLSPAADRLAPMLLAAMCHEQTFRSATATL